MEKIAPDEFDAMTGVTTRTGIVDDKLVITKDADLSANVEYATALRNADQYSSDGINRGFFHVAHIDPITNMELLKIGVDVMTASAKQIVAGLHKLNRERFITTRKRV